jgi:polyhydroxybutyrate depolymerase
VLHRVSKMTYGSFLVTGILMDAAPTPAGYVSPAPQRIDSGGIERTFRVYRPANLDPSRRAPLVVVLHGGFGTGAGAEAAYGWDQQADKHGFIVAYPDGYRRSWNAGNCCGQAQDDRIDDVAFLDSMIHHIETQDRIDPDAIAIAGMSNGAMMAYRMACESKIPLRAIGAVAGTTMTECPHPQRLNVMAIHGTADRNVPFAGGQGSGPVKLETPPIETVIARWREIDACRPPRTTNAGAVRTESSECADGRAVDLVTIVGAGHQWPGGAPPTQRAVALLRMIGVELDPPSTALNATETLLRFFFGF